MKITDKTMSHKLCDLKPGDVFSFLDHEEKEYYMLIEACDSDGNYIPYNHLIVRLPYGHYEPAVTYKNEKVRFYQNVTLEIRE